MIWFPLQIGQPLVFYIPAVQVPINIYNNEISLEATTTNPTAIEFME